MTTAMLASVLAAFVLCLVVIFQFLLALALPFGRAAWGGTHRVSVSRPVRLAAWIVLARTGVVMSPWQPATVRAATWVAFSILALNTVANLASKSRVERLLMTPAAFVCSVCLLIAALSEYQ